ncbi:175_t:CDS:2 [Acaulospora morrowiae]|uniref:175_t:CDS:1 n=1 Tax=Acaulospora morrowiae TaxID=94023 RepID=A0A9N9FIS7_9GLOM|nr:175_t:CDS:2 [Acaulospora morrowiae]
MGVMRRCGVEFGGCSGVGRHVWGSVIGRNGVRELVDKNDFALAGIRGGA